MSSNEEFGNIAFDLPKNQSNVIKVIGVGGGGSNAINHMFQQGIKGVDFVICNTDAQALENSPIPNKIQLGLSLTEGLGAGANPKVGEQSAVESYEDIKNMLGTNTKMIFITAGMGGGTGTGAAPIIAKMARELDILTVGIVTIPFQFEGKMRNEQAQIGIEKLRAQVDSLVVINNNKLREVYGNLGFKAGFSKADEVLATASRGIAEVITHHYTQNIDLRDAKTVLSNSGTAIMGSANASGAKRAHDAIVKALDSPLLNDNKITGAKNVLLLIVSGKEEITIDEIGEINDHIQQEAGHGANIIMGVGEDESLEDAISVTVIATGFDVEQQDEIVNTEAKRIIHTLEDEQRAAIQNLSPKSTTTVLSSIPNREPKKEEPAIIKHELIEDEPETIGSLLIPTTDFLRNIDVIEHQEVVSAPSAVVEVDDNIEYQEITAMSSDSSSDTDFVIINAQDIIKQIEVNDANEVEAEKEKEDQFSLSFDMSSSDQNEEYKIHTQVEEASSSVQEEEERPIIFDLTDDILEVEVHDPIEVVPQVTAESNEVLRYSLEDYMEEEKRLTEAKPIQEDKEVAFEKKTIPAAPEELGAIESVDPINQPISESLKGRAAERRAKMKEFNYKFKNNNPSINDIEKEPAYKRAGLDIDSKPESSELSRTSIGTDSNDDIQLRKNNSFLHDNVD